MSDEWAWWILNDHQPEVIETGEQSRSGRKKQGDPKQDK